MLADQLAGPLGQRQQQVERAAAERRGLAVHQQAAFVGLQLETAEAQRRSSPWLWSSAGPRTRGAEASA